MSSGWHWYVILGTLLTLAGFVWLLFANRKTSGNETTGHKWDGIEELDNPLPMWWVGMFGASIVFTVLYLVVYPGLGNFAGVIGWTSVEQHDREAAAHESRFAPLYAKLASMDADELAADKQAMQVGRRLYLNHCSTCHGTSASGTTGFPDLSDNHWIWGSDFSAIKQSIALGRTGVMPPWEAMLDDQAVLETVHMVLEIAGQEHDASLAENGVVHYNTYCLACHGPEGKGIAALGAPDLTTNVWVYGGSIEDLTHTIKAGRQGQMPAHADILSDDKTHVLAAYVKSLSQ